MEIRSNNSTYIIAPLSPKMGEYEINRLLKKINTEVNNRNLALDLRQISDCTIEFLEAIREISKNRSLGIFNISSDIFTLFNYMHIDKSANLFVSELDFKENRRHIINRNFSLI